MKPYPKIFTIGTDYIRDIFNDEVEVTEKVDGSQFVFGRIDGEVHIRSKGATLYFDNHQKMFSQAISYIDLIQDKLPENIIFYAEYLQRPKHNTLKYDRVPKNHLMLFGAMHHKTEIVYPEIDKCSENFGIERIPVIYKGKINDVSELFSLLEKESILGGTKVEGIVVKNFNQPFLLGGQPIPLMVGKLVSESFKEVHQKRWSAEEKGKSRIEVFFEGFRTEARWEKAVQHLAERNELENEVRDIGKLIKEIHSDIEAEEIENIKKWLWGEFKGQLMRRGSAGFPEWYKKRLAEKSFKR